MPLRISKLVVNWSSRPIFVVRWIFYKYNSSTIFLQDHEFEFLINGEAARYDIFDNEGRLHNSTQKEKVAAYMKE